MSLLLGREKNEMNFYVCCRGCDSTHVFVCKGGSHHIFYVVGNGNNEEGVQVSRWEFFIMCKNLSLVLALLTLRDL